MPDLLAYLDVEDTYEAVLYGPGLFSARRDVDGVWASPAPDLLTAAQRERVQRIEGTEAMALLAEALAALAEPTFNRPRATPAQLLEAARDYNRRRKLGEDAEILAKRVIYRALQQAKAPQGALIFGTTAWCDAVVKRLRQLGS